jgi:hypothetical protein
MKRVALKISNLSIADKIIAAKRIHENMSTNASLFTTPAIPLAQLLTEINDLILAQQKRIQGSVADRVARDIALETLLASLKTQASYVQTISEGKEEVILAAGMYVALRGPRYYDMIEAPYDLRASYGDVEGQVKLRWKKLKTLKNFEIGWCADPITDDGWKQSHFTTSSRTVVSGLPTGAVVWLRVRGTSAAGTSDWSLPLKQRVS